MKPYHRVLTAFLLLMLMTLFVGSIHARPDDEARQGRVRRAVRGLGLSASPDVFEPACLISNSIEGTFLNDNNAFMVSLGTNPFDLTFATSGMVLVFNFPPDGMHEGTATLYPTICTTITSTLSPVTASRNGTPIAVENSLTDFASRWNLPISAYTQPGRYRYTLSDGRYVEFDIPAVPAGNPTGVTYQRTGGSCDYALMGFQPNEVIVGLFLDSQGFEQAMTVNDSIEVTSNSSGNATATGTRCRAEGEMLLLIGSAGSGLTYPDGNGLIIPSAEEIQRLQLDVAPEILALEGQFVGGDVLIDYLRPFVFDGTTTDSTSTTNVNCPGALTSRLAVGGNTQRASNNVRIRSNPGTDQLQIGWIDSSAPAAVIGGPECIGGMVWWQIDFNSITGWAAEATSSGYLLVPANSSNNTGAAGTGASSTGNTSSGSIDPTVPPPEDNPPGSLYVENAFFDASSDDVYEVYGYQGQTIYISFASDGSFQPYLDFQDQNGSTLATASDFPQTELSYTLPYTGTYYIVAWAAGDAGSGFYTLTALWQ